MDSKLAEELKVPLTKLLIPIMLRLADGDSSSTLTHRTVPLQLHIGKHVETVSFYVTSLCHGLLLGYSWLEKHNPRINWVSRMVDFDSSYCLENCSTGSTRTQGLGKPPTIEKIMPLNPEPMEPCVQDASDSGKELTSGPSIYVDFRFYSFRCLSFPGCFSGLQLVDKLRLCMDYRGLNKNTIKDRNPIPLISEMLRTLSIGKVFTTWTCAELTIFCESRRVTNPKLRSSRSMGQFEFLVMPFGLANAPAQFQRMMNTLFRDSIGKFVLVYLDDIVVYSEIWKRIRSIFLAHPCDSKPFILETDASDFAISGVLSQFDDLDQIRPVAFYARQMNSAERNYEIYDKELLAIVDSFKHWRHFLQGGLHPVTVLCDHKSLEYFMSTKKLTRRQARWSLELSEYDFSITHRPGKLNGRADALSRQSDHHLENDCSNFKRILDPKQIIDLQSLISDMDLHVIVHSEVLQKVFVLESDWPLIIADFLAGEDNVWMDDIPEVTLEKCKKELKNFRFRDDTFLRILEDGKSTATYVHYDSDQRLFDITTNPWHT
ncbi:hypothetical protein BASA61_007784 [Batrachochytrium salamandrivorans]|nr:hypothetical protein BASA61_007784 [Batrachochytrium salamandrivorans]